MNADILKEQAECKEKELRELQSIRIGTLENLLKEKSDEYELIKSQFDELKTDFLFNLDILSERDKELSILDKKSEDLESEIKSKNVVIADLQQKVAQQKNALDIEQKWVLDMKSFYEVKLKEKDLYHEQYKCEKETLYDNEKKEMENYKRKLDRRLIEIQQEMTLQENDLKECYEENLKKYENDKRIETDQLRNNIFASDLKIKMLSNQLDVLREARQCGSSDLEVVQSEFADLENNLKRKEWELQDLTAITNAKIFELEEKFKNCNNLLIKKNNENKERCSEISNLNIHYKNQIVKLKQSNEALESQYKSEIEKLGKKYNEEQVKSNLLESNLKKISEENKNIIDRLNNELDQIRLEFNRQINTFTLQQTQNDLEMSKVKEMMGCLREEIRVKNKDIQKYQDELAKNLNDISSLNSQKKQLCVDFQHQIEKLKFNNSKESENVIKSLTEGRNESISKVKLLEQQVESLQKFSSSIMEERDALKNAVVDTTKASISNDKKVLNDGVLGELRKENEELRQVVKMMRQEMEGIVQADNIVSPKDRKELESLKIKCKNLEEKLTQFESNMQISEGQSDLRKEVALENNLSENTQVTAHVKDLNQQLGELRKEKMSLTTQICKYQSRILHLETILDSEESKKNQTEIEQLQYELNSVRRRTDFEQSHLKQRITELELQLSEACIEADQFHRANVQANNEITRLSNQISRMKIDSADKQPFITFGAQELVIEQLQDQLQQLLSRRETTGRQDADVVEWEEMQQATQRIQSLEKEKQILVELSNKMRAELKGKNSLAAMRIRKDEKYIRSHAKSENQQIQDIPNLDLQITTVPYKTNKRVSKSSITEGSLTDVWRMLDSNDSDLLKKDEINKTSTKDDWTVKGISKNVSPRQTVGLKSISNLRAGSSKKGPLNEPPSKQSMLQQRIQTYSKKAT